MSLDLEQHLVRQMAFSRATFGPGERRLGVIDHIRKELKEVEAGDGEASEWVDVVILALDGLWRRLEATTKEEFNGRTLYRMSAEDIARIAAQMIVGKQGRNERRTWPDWRTMSPDAAIEHDRSAD